MFASPSQTRGSAYHAPRKAGSSRSSTASIPTWRVGSAERDWACTSPGSSSAGSAGGSGSSRTTDADRCSTSRFRPPPKPGQRVNPAKRLEQAPEKSVANRIREAIPGDETMGMTVLIVDDHPSFRASARSLLEADGYEIVGEAENGAAAVRAAEALHPDLVLLDVQLPDLD